METLPCRHCGHEVSGKPPRCPYCAREDPAKPAHGPAQEAKSQALVTLFGVAIMGTVLAIVLGLMALLG
jgi:primosomal protein N'